MGEKLNPWLIYTDAIHKMREFGASIKEMDLIDELTLSSEQMRTMITTILFDGVKRSVPHPDEEWAKFASAVKAKVASSGKNKAFSVSDKKFKALIDIKKLTETYGVHGGGESQVCRIS